MSNLYTDMGIEGDTQAYLRIVHGIRDADTLEPRLPNVEVREDIPISSGNDTPIHSTPLSHVEG